MNLNCFHSAPVYSLTLAQAHAGREIASLSYPKGDPAHKIVPNLNLVNSCVSPPLGD